MLEEDHLLREAFRKLALPPIAACRLERLAHGEESAAWAFSDMGKRYVLRINRSREGFEKDRFAFHNFASPDLPIPAILEIGSVGWEHSYSVSARAPGVTLQDLAPFQMDRMVASAHRALMAIAATDVSQTTGYGWFDSAGIASENSWVGYLMLLTNDSLHDWPVIARCSGAAEIPRLVAALRRLCNGRSEERALVHGDFGSNNVLSDGMEITGVIDWSEAIIGDPLYDVANLFFWRTKLPCMEAHAHYIERHIKLAGDAAVSLLCYQLHIGLREVYDNTKRGDVLSGRWALTRTREIWKASNGEYI